MRVEELRNELESLETLRGFGYSAEVIDLAKEKGFVGVYTKMGYCRKTVYLINEDNDAHLFLARYDLETYIRSEQDVMYDMNNLEDIIARKKSLCEYAKEIEMEVMGA